MSHLNISEETLQEIKCLGLPEFDEAHIVIPLHALGSTEECFFGEEGIPSYALKFLGGRVISMFRLAEVPVEEHEFGLMIRAIIRDSERDARVIESTPSEVKIRFLSEVKKRLLRHVLGTRQKLQEILSGAIDDARMRCEKSDDLCTVTVDTFESLIREALEEKLSEGVV